MFSYFGMLPAVMYDSALRDITGKAINFKLNDIVKGHKRHKVKSFREKMTFRTHTVKKQGSILSPR